MRFAFIPWLLLGRVERACGCAACSSFVLVEDVVSSGGAIIDAVSKLKVDGFVPDAALCVIDRGSGGVEALATLNLPLVALYRLSQVESA